MSNWKCGTCGHELKPIPTYKGSPYYCAVAGCENCKEEGRKTYLTHVNPTGVLPDLTAKQQQLVDSHNFQRKL
jgi:hypothetical protein